MDEKQVTICIVDRIVKYQTNPGGYFVGVLPKVHGYVCFLFAYISPNIRPLSCINCVICVSGYLYILEWIVYIVLIQLVDFVCLN